MGLKWIRGVVSGVKGQAIITLAIVKIEQKSIVHLKINYNWMQDIMGAHFLPTIGYRSTLLSGIHHLPFQLFQEIKVEDKS